MINLAKHRLKLILKLFCISMFLSSAFSINSNDPNLIRNFILDSKYDGVENFDESIIEEPGNDLDNDNSNYRYDSDCYDSATGQAKKCMPDFINAAFGLKITASNTCGLKSPSEYCVQTNLHGLYYRGSYQEQQASNDYTSDARCRKCDFNDKHFKHPPEFLNDHNNQGNVTWWQSDTMLEGIQYPNSVNLTLNLGKSFEINYVQIKFHSPRPESFAIYKRTDENSEWTPYQFYSASCKATYGKDPNQVVKPGNEAVALCTDEFSDIAPLTGASVVFGTLEDRPSAYNFENTPELIEWVSAMDIRITLNRLNTFGDEVFYDPQVLKSYYYAISDIAVGGRCKCNGHASKCVNEQQQDFEDRIMCKCEHFTDGPDCNICLPFYNDVPWAPATQFNAHECKPCFCNGLSNKCHYNQTLYDMTGRGGYCDDCEGNTSGPHCEECKHGFYRRENENRCIDCQCNTIGSEGLQCDPNGKCKCKPGIVGDKCDRCEAYHYELSNTGCKKCECNPAGSFDRPPVCDPRDGTCRCKTNVEGKNCDRPKPGFFNLSPDNPLGAIPCFCYSHSSTCNSSSNFYEAKISAEFRPGKNFVIDYTSKISQANLNQNELSYLINSTGQDVWFLVPDEFLGNQLNSYNQMFSFELRIENMSYFKPRASRKDLVIENKNEKLEVYIPIYGSNSTQKTPDADKQTFVFILNQYSNWMPQLSSRDFQRLLTNVSSIKIRASYAPYSVTVLSKIEMKTAKPYDEKTFDQPAALFVEECSCPIGHMGQRCETCSPGYRRDPINGGPFAKCVPCNCNNHSMSCDIKTGKCDCKHHTNGDNCEKCEYGYYGNPIYSGNLNELNSFEVENVLSNLCKKCPCPNDGECAEIFNYQLSTTEIVCLSCPEGTQGNLCEMCHDGYFSKENGVYSKCEKCTCNGNIDENAIFNCDPTNGKCKKCIYNTTGDNCEKCLPNYYGNALSSFKCQYCDCFEKGSNSSECDLIDGQCTCKPNVKNRRCDECRKGYWNIESGNGCQECNCNPLGSFNNTCDPLNGQCYCRPGVQGHKCDSCMPLYYGFSDKGCTKCECDPLGTQLGNLQCDEFGKCSCQENFSGLKCNQCAENRFNFTNRCQRCDECYNLVQNQVDLLRNRIKDIEEGLNLMQQNGFEIDHDQSILLQQKLESVKMNVENLHSKLFHNLRSSYQDSVNYLRTETKRLTEAIKSTDQLFNEFNVLFKDAQKVFNKTSNSVTQAESQLNFIKTQNDEQKMKIEVLKEKKNDNYLNDRLQELAKEARESAETDAKQAKEFAEDVSRNIAGAKATLDNIKNMLAKYELFEIDSSMVNFVDFNVLVLTANSLKNEAIMQKSQLEKDIVLAKDLIKRIENFKIPSELDLNLHSPETIDLVNLIESKKNSIRKQIEAMQNNYEQFANMDSILIINNAKNELNKASQKQKGIDYLMEYSQNVLIKINSAHSLTNELEKNASKILETLRKFDQLILKGKEEILNAQGFRQDTEQNVRESETLYALIKEKIDLLKLKLNESKNYITRTNKLITQTKQNYDGLDKDLIELNIMSGQLMKKTSEMNSALDEYIKIKSNEAVDKLSNFESRNEFILKQSESITNRTQYLLDSANNALEDLLEFNKTYKEFSTSSDLKKEDIQQLEQRFEEVSSYIDDDIKLDESIETLELRTNFLMKRVKEYSFHLKELSAQVKNLEEINNSLERKCYANTFAKPEL